MRSQIIAALSVASLTIAALAGCQSTGDNTGPTAASGNAAGGSSPIVDSKRLRAADSPEFFTSIATLAGGRILSVPGGVFVRDAEGRLLGAVGVTGDASLNDEAAAVAGIAAAGLVAVTGAE